MYNFRKHFPIKESTPLFVTVSESVLCAAKRAQSVGDSSNVNPSSLGSSSLKCLGHSPKSPGSPAPGVSPSSWAVDTGGLRACRGDRVSGAGPAKPSWCRPRRGGPPAQSLGAVNLVGCSACRDEWSRGRLGREASRSPRPSVRPLPPAPPRPSVRSRPASRPAAPAPRPPPRLGRGLPRPLLPRPLLVPWSAIRGHKSAKVLSAPFYEQTVR